MSILFRELQFTASAEPLFGRAFDYAVIAVLDDPGVYGVNVHVALFRLTVVLMNQPMRVQSLKMMLMIRTMLTVRIHRRNYWMLRMMMKMWH